MQAALDTELHRDLQINIQLYSYQMLSTSLNFKFQLTMNPHTSKCNLIQPKYHYYPHFEIFLRNYGV